MMIKDENRHRKRGMKQEFGGDSIWFVERTGDEEDDDDADHHLVVSVVLVAGKERWS